MTLLGPALFEDLRDIRGNPQACNKLANAIIDNSQEWRYTSCTEGQNQDQRKHMHGCIIAPLDPRSTLRLRSLFISSCQLGS
jgi:hypothetical protein